jgi:hypothetical protein
MLSYEEKHYIKHHRYTLDPSIWATTKGVL